MQKGFSMSALSRLLRRAVLCFFMTSFLFNTFARGEDLNAIIQKIEAALQKQNERKTVPFLEEFRKALERMKAMKSELSKLKASIGASYTGNSAGEKNSHILGIETEIGKDVYPRAMRFKAGTRLSVKDSQLQDEMTSLLLNLDAYLFPQLEVYGFVERFTDTFMSIKERYETGIGVKFEVNASDPLKKIGENRERHVKEKNDKTLIRETIPAFMAEWKKILDDPENQGKTGESARALESAQELFEDLDKERKNMETALWKKRSRLTGGLAVTFLSEIEQAEFENVPLKAAQRYRIVLRPSLEWHVLDSLILNAQCYLKEPLGKPYKMDGRMDYRYNLLTSAQLKLPKDPFWGGDVSLVFEYGRNYDNAPPKLSEARFAENTHDMFSMKINISF